MTPPKPYPPYAGRVDGAGPSACLSGIAGEHPARDSRKRGAGETWPYSFSDLLEEFLRRLERIETDFHRRSQAVGNRTEPWSPGLPPAVSGTSGTSGTTEGSRGRARHA
ncbi:hypothetical protein GCM10010446_23580 [Streptomyces enissocaesilis]|uniref:Uncharacterized protein n=1 Tax=Streptomyces enissocaesilis TaxID=332589 RepID=A0ABP6JM18_9ACTN